MNNPPPPTVSESRPQASNQPAHCDLHICTSCRTRGAPREPKEGRPGYQLYQQVRDAVEGGPLRDHVSVQPATCLSICPRPCGIALSSPGRWTYLFGDQQPETTVDDILACITLYIESSEGFMARAERPQSLRKGILGRVPPRKGVNKCI